jgi:thymidine phosphorylase
MSIHPEPGARLRIRRLSLDTGRENIAVMQATSPAMRAEVFRAFSRVRIRAGESEILATLITTDDPAMLGPDELGLADPAFRRFAQPPGTEAHLIPAVPPDSMDAVRRKIAGQSLSDGDITAIVRDLAEYRYADIEIAAFLVGAAGFITTDELLSLTRAMADVGTRLHWSQERIVDKHCIGGIPGNRTSMIVVPIVAAHGLVIPKTSSRAITSPAGTADTMEVLARVDLTIEEMRAVVDSCGGCLIWGGHVRLSPADDILISVERPLGIDTREMMVASILSKKLAAGSTHLVVDIPLGPTAKVRHVEEATRLRKLFEHLGDRLGLSLEVVVTDGAQPIGRGIGPVLEARDVMAVLRNAPDAPEDLREKSIALAGRIIATDPALRGGTSEARARELLTSGAALAAMERIIAAQGPPPEQAKLGEMTAEIMADRDGTVIGIDNLRLNRLARIAGAPVSKGAGIDLHCKIGARVRRGEPLYRIHASEHFEFDYACEAARSDHGYRIA